MEFVWNLYGTPMEQHRSHTGATPEHHASIQPGRLCLRQQYGPPIALLRSRAGSSWRRLMVGSAGTVKPQ
jgi:hypothetical protein